MAAVARVEVSLTSGYVRRNSPPGVGTPPGQGPILDIFTVLCASGEEDETYVKKLIFIQIRVILTMTYHIVLRQVFLLTLLIV